MNRSQAMYDPFARGPDPVGVRTIEIVDRSRARTFPCEFWYPAEATLAGQDLDPAAQDVYALQPDDAPRRQSALRDAPKAADVYPLLVYSHSSGRWNRRTATYLCTHLASHGYFVAALDHSETVAPELKKNGPAMLASRVPDIIFLLDYLLDPNNGFLTQIDPRRIGIVGHSFGGWTALATPECEKRVGTIVALAPAGSTNPKPGILAGKLAFGWGRDVPTMYLTGENDVMIPLSGVQELFGRTESTKRFVVLRGADHMHFMDHVEEEHEIVRATQWPEQLAWIPNEMRPISDLVSGEHAHIFTRGLTLSHVDAYLKEQDAARTFLSGDISCALAEHGIDAYEPHGPKRMTETDRAGSM